MSDEREWLWGIKGRSDGITLDYCVSAKTIREALDVFEKYTPGVEVMDIFKDEHTVIIGYFPDEHFWLYPGATAREYNADDRS